jgi:uncharacterized membrane protein
MKNRNLLTTHPAVIAVWAAMIAAVTLVPAFPIIGTGATFSVNAALNPLAGILFGPVAGALCAAIGTFVGQLIAPHTVFFGPLSFLIPALGALCAGFAMRKRWYVPLLVILLFSAAWYLVPLGRQVWFQPAIWLLGVAACLVGWFVASDWIGSDNRTRLFIGVFLAALSGTIVDHAFGCLWALIQFQLPAEVWLGALPLAPVERILFSVGAAIIGTPLLIGLPKIGLPVGQQMAELEDNLDDEDLTESDRSNDQPRS